MNPSHDFRNQVAPITGARAGMSPPGSTWSRRGVLAGALGVGVAIGRHSYAQSVATPVPALGYDGLTRGPAPIPPAERSLQTVIAAPWVKVSDGGIVLEGPAFARDGSLFLCDASGGRVLRLSPDRRLSTVLEMGLKPGGIAIHRDGRLFVAALDIPNGLGSISAVRPDGSDLRAIIPTQAGYLPNDLVFDAHGGLYFSDFRGTSTNPAGGIYYVSPDGLTVTPVLSRIAKANGVALSPDGKVLWATEFGNNRLHRAELASATMATPLGTAIPYRFIGPAPDSMRADADGNVYVALYGQGRILVLNGMGIPIGQILLPGRDEGHNLLTTNMAFRPGSNDLLIVASDGERGQGAGIFHVGAFAQALPLYAQQ